MMLDAGRQDTRSGWPVVAAAFVGLLLSVGIVIIYSFGVLTSAMAQEHGWGETQRSAVFLSFSLASALAGPVWGWIGDRFGSRRAAIVSSILLALLLLTLAAAPAGLLLICAIFSLIGLFGSGTLPPLYVSVVVGWFDRYRGLALGVAMMGVGIGAALFPIITASVTATYGWRTAWAFCAVLILLISVPICFFFLRENVGHPARRLPAAAERRSGAVASVFRQRTAQLLLLFAFITGSVLVAVVTSFVPMLRGRGVPLEQASLYQALVGVALLVGRGGTGYLLDKVFAPRLMTVLLVLGAAGLFALSQGDGTGVYVIAALAIGLAVGAEIDFLGYVASRYFDRTIFTTVFALLFASYSIGGTIGPFAAGWFADRLGGYNSVLLVQAGALSILGLALFALPRYPKP